MIHSEVDAFRDILAYIEETTGIQLPETNYRLVRGFLEQRSAALGMSPRGYRDYLKGHPQENDEFLDVVTINETYFFREERHYRVLRERIFPLLKERGQRGILVWSAACSTGEEPLSLASLALEFWPAEAVRVFASDLNSRALERFQSGLFRKSSFREDGASFHGYLTPFLEERRGGYRPDSRLLKPLRIFRHNLAAGGASAITEPLDIIFLRNTLIYMDTGLRMAVMARLAHRLAPGGYLFLASAEVPLLGHPELSLEEWEGCYYFRKKGLEEKRAGLIPGPEMAAAPPPAEKPPSGRSRPIRKPFRVADILKHISLRLNNPLYEADGDRTFAAALEYLEVVFLLNSGELNRAEAVSKELISRWGGNEVTDYLQGMTALRREAAGDAIPFFDAALSKRPGFWPARYQRALLLKEAKPVAALRDFRSALRSIEAYIHRDLYSYQFLLEGFNARYFSGICSGWIEKLREKGASYGP